MDYNFTWDEVKERINIKKHGVSFDEALAVFKDQNSLTRQDRIEGGEYRWQTIGMASGQVILLVAHTVEDVAEGTEIRLISARKATKKEREYYGQNCTQI